MQITCDKTPMIMRLLPVNSSLPATMTMARPAGKTQPETSFASDGSPTVAAAAVDAAPASATKAPAMQASRNIRPSGSAALARQAER